MARTGRFALRVIVVAALLFAWLVVGTIGAMILIMLAADSPRGSATWPFTVALIFLGLAWLLAPVAGWRVRRRRAGRVT
jgi:hypothetical protein